MAAPTVRARASGEQNGDATSHVITLPAGVLVDDLLLVFFSSDDATVEISTTSTGWAILNSIAQGSTTNCTGALLWKRATGSDALTVKTNTAQSSTHISFAIVDGGTPEEEHFDQGSSLAVTPSPIAPSGGTNDYLGIIGITVDSSTSQSQTITPSSGWSNLTSKNPTSGNTTSAGTFTFERSFINVASITPGNASLSAAEQWVCYTVAIKYQAQSTGGGGGGGPTPPPPANPVIRAVVTGGEDGDDVLLPRPADLSVGDYMLAFVGEDADGDLSSITAPSGFATSVSIAGSASPDIPFVKLFTKVAGPTDVAASTFKFTAHSNADYGVILVVIQAGTYDTASPIGTPATTSYSGSKTTSHVAPSAAGLAGGLLLCFFIADTSPGFDPPRTYTGTPTGMTKLGEAYGDNNSYATAVAFSQVLAGAGGTGSRTATLNTSTRYDAVSVVVNAYPALPVGIADTGTGTDAVTGIARTSTFTDSGVGTDMAIIRDAATGSVIVQVRETGVGTDLLKQVGPIFGDTGVGTDTISIIEIPFTQVLAPFRPGVTYDCVIVARIPQPNGIPVYAEIDPIEWSNLTYSNALSEPQECYASALISSLTPPIVQRLRKLHELATELWVYRNGRLVFAGPIRGWNITGQTVTITARGLLDYLKHMVIANDMVFKQVDQFTIVKQMVDQWQSLQYGNFGILTDAVGLSGMKRDGSYLKTELHQVAQRVVEISNRNNGFDIEVDPSSRQLQLWYPQKGFDRSTGENAVVFDARNITNANAYCSVSPEDVASEGFATGTGPMGDGTLYATAGNPELRARYGRTGVTATWDSVILQSTLNDHIQGYVDARGEALIVPGPDARNTPDSDITAYSVGDTVAYQPTEVLTDPSAFRIRKQMVKVAGTGQETVSLEFV